MWFCEPVRPFLRKRKGRGTMSSHAVTLHKRRPVAIAFIAALVLGLLAVLPMPARQKRAIPAKGPAGRFPSLRLQPGLRRERPHRSRSSFQVPRPCSPPISSLSWTTQAARTMPSRTLTATLDRLVAEAGGVDQVRVGVVSFKGDGHVEGSSRHLTPVTSTRSRAPSRVAIPVT